MENWVQSGGTTVWVTTCHSASSAATLGTTESTYLTDSQEDKVRFEDFRVLDSLTAGQSKISLSAS